MQSERRLIENRVTRLCGLIRKIDDDEIKAELTQHLCVLTSGLLEVCCRDILEKYSKVRCSPQVLRHITKSISGFQNANAQKIFDLFSSFDPVVTADWQRNLLEEETEGINSIVTNRHQIAHGRSIGLSFDVLYRYYKSALSALQKLEAIFPGNKGE